MDRQRYRQALGLAAQAIRAERGHKSVAALARNTSLTESLARRVEGSKEPGKDLQLATIEEYVSQLGVSLGDLFTRADEIYRRDHVSKSDEPQGPGLYIADDAQVLTPESGQESDDTSPHDRPAT